MRLRLIRRWIADLAAAGIDWRDALVALRPVTPRLWQSLNATERGRFLRHLQPYWDTHRHRCAPTIARSIGELRDHGRMQLLAGRLRGVVPVDGSFAVSLTRRGRPELETLEVGAIVNCTGPAGHLPSIPDPLLQSLLAGGLAKSDPHGLGLATGRDYRLEGPLADRLFHVGPFLKGQFWEATAVPELREHAQRLAETLLTDLANPRP